MTIKTKLVLDQVCVERIKQTKKWGEQNHNQVEWMAILTEEVGEAAREALEHHFKYAENPDALLKLREELIQVAAVAVAMVESLDRNELADGDE